MQNNNLNHEFERTGVNFINDSRTDFSYERCFLWSHVHRKTMFVQKIHTYNVDEIDTKILKFADEVIIQQARPYWYETRTKFILFLVFIAFTKKVLGNASHTNVLFLNEK